MTPLERAGKAAMSAILNVVGEHIDLWPKEQMAIAHAVLLAIREPSEGMILSGVKALSDSGVDEANLDDAKLCHLAMIDKALEEG